MFEVSLKLLNLCIDGFGIPLQLIRPHLLLVLLLKNVVVLHLEVLDVLVQLLDLLLLAVEDTLLWHQSGLLTQSPVFFVCSFQLGLGEVEVLLEREKHVLGLLQLANQLIPLRGQLTDLQRQLVEVSSHMLDLSGVLALVFVLFQTDVAQLSFGLFKLVGEPQDLSLGGLRLGFALRLVLKGRVEQGAAVFKLVFELARLHF